MTAALDIAYPTGNGVEFYGFQVLEFYIKQFLLLYADYPWTIRLLYGLIMVCIITMLVLFMLFIHRIRLNNREKRAFLSARKKLHDGFYNILVDTEKPDGSRLEAACGMSQREIMSYRPELLSRLISEICMDLSRELGDIPNADSLCSLTGVKTYYEKNLTTGKNVLLTLQDIADMHIPINEGLLAIYLNHHDLSLRHMSRMCFILASTDNPYRYLREELDTKLGLWHKMMLHRMFAWARANERQMPQFLVLAKELHNESSGAFLIQETAYWGSEKEKAALHDFFLSPIFSHRKAALHAVSILRDASQEQAAIDSYELQPEGIRQEVLQTVAAINSGRHTDFFVWAFHHSTSKLTREVALTSLYTYGTDGRRTFELLRDECIHNNTDRTLMDQIDSLSVLNQLRGL